MRYGFGIRIGDWDSVLGRELGIKIGIRDYDFRLGLGIGIWELGFLDRGLDIGNLDWGLGIGIRNKDWELKLGNWIKDYDLVSRLGIEI